MRILLIGEYSRLHNSLKEGLEKLGHEVLLVSDGDDFKNYKSDLSYAAKWWLKPVPTLVRKGFHKLLKIDLSYTERAFRFWKIRPQLKGFDVVQLINERPIKTFPRLEKWLLRALFRDNKKAFLLSCGTDSINMQFMMDRKFRYSILTPFFEGIQDRSYRWLFLYLRPAHLKLARYVHQNVKGIIASDLDYHLPLQNHPKYLGMIPNPINTDEVLYKENLVAQRVSIFVGINRYTETRKGIRFFREALEVIEAKYSEKVAVTLAQNMPYEQYIKRCDSANILMDQVYAYDQGYNALEAMARGKVVFTGAEKEFEAHYRLTRPVAMNALPDVDDIVTKLSELIENPEAMTRMGENARKFIEKEHDYVKVAAQYISLWQNS